MKIYYINTGVPLLHILVLFSSSKAPQRKREGGYHKRGANTKQFKITSLVQQMYSDTGTNGSEVTEVKEIPESKLALMRILVIITDYEQTTMRYFLQQSVTGLWRLW